MTSDAPAPPVERRFCVVGHPVEHSRSPAIHAAFGAQTGRALRYERLDVRPGALADAIASFRSEGGTGMNVTVPLKEEAFGLAARARERAAAAGAANTLWFDPFGALVADNTDGAGLVRDLATNHGVALAGARVLLLGAGGAARGVVPALLAAGIASLTITNRTAARAAALVGDLGGDPRLDVLAWGEAPEPPCDLVLNATSLSLHGERPPLPARAIGATTDVYDMMYGDGPTVFLAWAAERGARRAMDGLGMLVEQAAEAFRLWHGVRPATAPVVAALRRGTL